MSVSGSRTVTVNAPLDKVLETVRDVAGQVNWWPGTISAEVTETDDQGRVKRAALVNDVKVAKDTFDIDYAHTDNGMTWSLAAPSKAQKAQSGSWELTADGDKTEATLNLTIDVSLPLPGFVQKKVLNDTLKGATEGLKKYLAG